jgi:cytochrome P450
MAGTDTTFNSITYALVYMVKYPHVQQKVQEELDSVVGGDRLPGLEDRPR